MNTISERIKYLVDKFAEGNNSKFAKIVNTSEANVRNYIAGTQPKFDFLQSVAEAFEISCEWLLLGKGATNYIDKLKVETNQVTESTFSYGNNEKLLKEKDHVISTLKDQIATYKKMENYFDRRWKEYQDDIDRYKDEREKLLCIVFELGGEERLKDVI